MKLVVVPSQGASDFRRDVVRPLRKRYPDLECLELHQAVERFPAQHGTWDVVVLELSSPGAGDDRVRRSDLPFPERMEASVELALAASRWAEVVVCFQQGVAPKILERLQAAGAVLLMPVADFRSDLVDEVWIHRRAGFPTGQLDLDSHIGVLRERDRREYPLPRGHLRALFGMELPHSLDQASLVKEACDSLGRYDSTAIIEAIILMRAARLLARLEFEGVLFCVTLVLGSRMPPARDLVLALTSRLRIDLQPRSLPEIENLAELAQGTGSYVSVDAGSGVVHGIYAFTIKDVPHEKLAYFPRLAGRLKGMVFHLPGNRTVELYTAEGLRFKYDGFAWVHAPLQKLEVALSKRNVDVDFDLTPLIVAIEQLSSRRIGSIVAIDPQSFRSAGLPIALEDLRPSERPYPKSVAELGTETLISIFRLDGAHLIDRSGKIYKWAQNVSTTSLDVSAFGAASGTGRRAAFALSKAFPSAVVVKVSESGGRISIFKGGNLVLQEY